MKLNSVPATDLKSIVIPQHGQFNGDSCREEKIKKNKVCIYIFIDPAIILFIKLNRLTTKEFLHVPFRGDNRGRDRIPGSADDTDAFVPLSDGGEEVGLH